MQSYNYHHCNKNRVFLFPQSFLMPLDIQSLPLFTSNGSKLSHSFFPQFLSFLDVIEMKSFSLLYQVSLTWPYSFEIHSYCPCH